MDSSLYNQSGNYIAISGIIVGILAKFGVIIDTNSIATMIAGVIVIIGIVKQFKAHKKLAIASAVPVVK